MRIEIFRENIDLNEAEESFIREKIEHLAHFAGNIEDEATIVKVNVCNRLKNEGMPIVVEVTMVVPRAVIRAEESGVSLEEAIRNVYEKLVRQIEKYRDGEERRSRGGDWIEQSTLETLSEVADEYAEMPFVAKRKKLENVKPMTEAEAIHQMELIGHRFFIFRDMESEELRVVYKRYDNTYGVLEVT